jgi:alpha-galactosidase
MLNDLKKPACQSAIRSLDGSSHEVLLRRSWAGDVCTLALRNESAVGVRVKEVAVFCSELPLASTTPAYGEGYNMLSQYAGPVADLRCLTPHSDGGHYKLPQQPDRQTVYNLLLLMPPDTDAALIGFASCKRFAGEIRLSEQSLELVLDLEGQEIAAGAELELEAVFAATGEREALLAAFGDEISRRQPPLPWPEVPTGWCSWYCYGPDVTEQDVFDNLETIRQRFPELKYIQLDDGYQAHMGDWLDQHPNFPRPIRDLCHRIKDAGFEPAIWVAPFIADADSALLRDHPDWFVQDEAGHPLPSNRDSFGGWRFAPWYMLDGTHPEAQEYLRHVFRTMRQEWQCTYFKLDANMWGALPSGRRYDPKATRVDAYRAGMQAVLEGAGPDSFILGCNAPMWPSIGVVHGMRTTGDIHRSWNAFTGLAEQGFYRNWQNHRLWINDPDCLVMANLINEVVGPDGQPSTNSTDISEDEFSFHAAYILASGGMVLASDRMMELNEAHAARLAKLVPPTGKAARFDDHRFELGRIPHADGEIVCLFNWGDEARVAELPAASCTDFWTGEAVSGTLTLPPRGARVVRS